MQNNKHWYNKLLPMSCDTLSTQLQQIQHSIKTIDNQQALVALSQKETQDTQTSIQIQLKEIERAQSNITQKLNNTEQTQIDITQKLDKIELSQSTVQQNLNISKKHHTDIQQKLSTIEQTQTVIQQRLKATEDNRAEVQRILGIIEQNQIAVLAKLQAINDSQASKQDLQANATIISAGFDSIKKQIDEHHSQMANDFSSFLDWLITFRNISTPIEISDPNSESQPVIQDILNEDGTKSGKHMAKLLDLNLLFSDSVSFLCVVKELFSNESYFIEFDTDTPRVLDCGAHIGLASLYIKQQYKNARITAFEPDPENYTLAKQNLHNAGFDDVELIEKAVGVDQGQATFYRAINMSMGGSLSTRMKKSKDGIEEITVNTCRLRDYIHNDKIDFLKLDVEGIEDLIITDCADCISNVDYLFIEFHIGQDLSMARMLPILKVLDDNKFDYMISLSDYYIEFTKRRPFPKVGQNITHVIYAKRQKDLLE